MSGLLAGCGTAAQERERDPASRLLRRASRLYDGRTLQEIDWEQALDRLADADVVGLGETHLDQLTHDAELELLRELAARRGNAVTLSMEMFERDVQPALDDYLAGRITEADFLARARPWKNYATDYRPLVELAKREEYRLGADGRVARTADLRRAIEVARLASWGAAGVLALLMQLRRAR